MKTIGISLSIMLVMAFFSLSAQPGKNKPNAEGVYLTVDVMPVFPGGESGLRDFIAGNVIYPEQAKKDSITGKVFVSFVIDTTGKVEDTKVIRSVHPLLDTEAVRVISAMPAWTPGKNNGETVKVAFTLPIMFALK